MECIAYTRNERQSFRYKIQTLNGKIYWVNKWWIHYHEKRLLDEHNAWCIICVSDTHATKSISEWHSKNLIKSCHSNRNQQKMMTHIMIQVNLWPMFFFGLYHCRYPLLSIILYELDSISVEPPFLVDITSNIKKLNTIYSMLLLINDNMPGSFCSTHTRTSTMSVFFVTFRNPLVHSLSLNYSYIFCLIFTHFNKFV